MQIKPITPFIRFAAKPIDLTQVTSSPVETKVPQSDKPLAEKLDALAKQYGDTAERLQKRYDSLVDTLKLGGKTETEDEILARIEQEIKPKDPRSHRIKNVSLSMDECGGKV